MKSGPMALTVGLHASLTDALDTDSLRVSVADAPGGVRVSHVREALAHSYPKIRGLLAQARLAVDMEIVPDEHPVREGQRVDVLPPFSGG